MANILLDLYKKGFDAAVSYIPNKAFAKFVDYMFPKNQLDYTVGHMIDRVTGIFSALESSRRVKSDLDNYGYDYEDIKWPYTGYSGYSTGSSGLQTLNYVSSNVGKLYRKFNYR